MLQGVTDEFVLPAIVGFYGAMRDGDGILLLQFSRRPRAGTSRRSAGPGFFRLSARRTVPLRRRRGHDRVLRTSSTRSRRRSFRRNR